MAATRWCVSSVVGRASRWRRISSTSRPPTSTSSSVSTARSRCPRGSSASRATRRSTTSGTRALRTASSGSRECNPPFWGRAGRKKPDLPEHFRVTESAIAAVGGILPKSTFQVGGAGSVGSGSIRAFAVLAQLRDAGFAIWPFDEARRPMVVEVWPRACTGPVVKSDWTARGRYVDARYPRLPRRPARRRDRERGRVRCRGDRAGDGGARRRVALTGATVQ